MEKSNYLPADTEENAEDVQVRRCMVRGGDGWQVCGGAARSVNPRYWRRQWNTRRIQ